MAAGVPEGYIGGALQVVAPSRGDHFCNAARPRSLSGKDQLVTVFSALSAWSPGGTWAQALCAPAREEEAEGLAPRGTRPPEEAACSLGASWSQGGRRRENMTPRDTWSCHSRGIW